MLDHNNYKIVETLCLPNQYDRIEANIIRQFSLGFPENPDPFFRENPTGQFFLPQNSAMFTASWDNMVTGQPTPLTYPPEIAGRIEGLLTVGFP